ncbi:MAG: ribosome small subunit-dependent GTPase A [Chitinispirillaceae bacterium]|jgi:ribosome biogenesis GTPase|nr:ribosome small subunit-dependent GTPase A [Chitinispirillaceae bacterium]
MEKTTIAKLGFNERIQNSAIGFLKDDLIIARVIGVNKNSCMVSDGLHEMTAELSGKLMFDTQEPAGLPTVGDWVAIQVLNNFTFAIIHSVLPRRTVLKRKEPGKRIGFQLIAANIDFGLVMQPADQLNFKLLDRYIVMLNECSISPIIIISKIDLLSSEDIELLRNDLAGRKNQYVLISNTADKGTDAVSGMLIPRKTYCLLGKSGVGKTSLLNALLHTNFLKVNEIREKDGRGRHTTVRRQLICLDTGSIIIDTPGMRELGNFEISTGLDLTFDEVLSHAQRCRFRDCSHTHEKCCAVLQAVTNGEIDEERYRNYLKLKKEADFHQISYLEKRKMDKLFGKMKKNYEKSSGHD